MYEAGLCVHYLAGNANKCSGRDRTRWHVPFERNSNFTGRKELLDDLRQRLEQQSNSTRKIAIIGLGGVGKTQLVLELAHHMREHCAVFWIPVNNLANLQTAYYEVAKQLRLPGCEKNGDHILELVQSYLSDESIGPWLLVLDNAENFALWTSPCSPGSGQKCLIDLLPKSTQGSIIFTARNRKVGVDLAQNDVVEVPAMDESGATQLLQNYLVNKTLVDTDCHVVPVLLKYLTYLPLAIVQAASYINKNRTSLSAYKDLLLEKDESAMALLEQEFQDDGRYRDTMNAVATTWMISFEQICREDFLAAEYLCLIACVDSKDIPESLLQGWPATNKISAIGTLDAYSFLKKHSDKSTLDMHPLIHLATRGWLIKKEELTAWQSEAVNRLRRLLADADEPNRTKWRMYISHAQFAVFDHIKAGDEMIHLAVECGRCLKYDGRYHEEETMCRIVLKHREKVLGPKHPDTLASINNLGSVLSGQGKYEEAEAMHQQALRDGERVWGPEHPATITSINNLGLVLYNQGKYEEAEGMYRQALRDREKVQGPEHPDTITSVNNLGLVLSDQGKYEEAEAMYRRALRDREKVQGPKHPDTLTILNKLGLVLAAVNSLQCLHSHLDQT